METQKVKDTQAKAESEPGLENSLAVQWLRLHASTARGPGSTFGKGTKILQTAQHSCKIKRTRSVCFLFHMPSKSLGPTTFSPSGLSLLFPRSSYIIPSAYMETKVVAVS